MVKLENKNSKSKKKKLSNKDKKPNKILILWRKFKIVWNNKQYKATIKLVLYFIFMLSILLIIQLGNQSRRRNNIVVKTPLQEFASTTNYTYKFIVDNGLTKVEVNGTHSNIDEIISIADKNYIVLNDKIYLDINGVKTETLLPFTIDITKLSPNNMKKLIDKGEELATTNYKSGEKETTYILPVVYFEKIINNKVVVSNEIVTISKKEKDKGIIGFTIELSNDYLLENLTIDIKNIELNFSKIK